MLRARREEARRANHRLFEEFVAAAGANADAAMRWLDGDGSLEELEETAAACRKAWGKLKRAKPDRQRGLSDALLDPRLDPRIGDSRAVRRPVTTEQDVTNADD